MIRRLATIFIIAALAGSAVMLRQPTPSVNIGEPLVQGIARHRGCLAVLERGVNASVQVGSTIRGPVIAGLVAGIGTVDPMEAEIDVAGGAMFDLNSLGAAGVTGVLVELPSVEAAAAISGLGPLGLFASSCTPPSTTRLTVAGGSTATGETLDLLMTNPYAQDAVVRVTGSSEVGIDNAATLEEIIIPAGTTISRSLDAELSLRRSLTTHLEVTRGAVHAAYFQQVPGDSALIEAVPSATDWWLPVVPIEGTNERLVISTSSPLEVAVQIDRYTSAGLDEAVRTLTIPPETQVDVNPAELGDGAAGLRVSADGPVNVTLVASRDGVRAATPAQPQIGTDWILPGSGALGGNIWISNPGDVLAEIVLQPLAPDTPARAATVPPGGTASVRIDRLGSGYLIRSASPVMMLWYAVSENGVLLSAPARIAVGE